MMTTIITPGQRIGHWEIVSVDPTGKRACGNNALCRKLVSAMINPFRKFGRFSEKHAR